MTHSWRSGRPVFGAGLLLWAAASACVQQPPPDLLQAIEALDRRLVAVQGAEFAPEEYAQFVEQWVAMRGRLMSEEDVIRWPWEPNTLLADLHRIKEQGDRAAAIAAERKERERLAAEELIQALERRLALFTENVTAIGGRVVLGRRPVETDLLVKQARSHLEQGQFARALQIGRRADELLDAQIDFLADQLGHYADERQVAAWSRMARRTIEWSRAHRATAILVSKADRRLTIYRNGRAVASYPAQFGFNGVMEKRYQGDGATPEGYYRVARKKDRGDTLFHRALLLDYPNAEDRRRFKVARTSGRLPRQASIGGEIEIHGTGDLQLSQTMGCVMLDDHDMDAVFAAVAAGTPVTIVGATARDNAVAAALAELERESHRTGRRGSPGAQKV
jgi:hypothetical protein